MTDIIMERPKFIDGMLLSAEEFSLEQGYFDRRLLQFGARFGRGVVQGLAVWPAATWPKGGGGSSSESPKIVVGPGCAVDAHGREIVLGKNRELIGVDGVLCIRWCKPQELRASDIGPSRSTPSNGEPIIRNRSQAELQTFPQGVLEQKLEDGWVPIARIEIRDGVPHSTAIPRLTGITRVSWNHAEHQPLPKEWWIKFSAPLKSKPPREAFDIRIRTGATETIVTLNQADIKLVEAGAKLSFEIDRNRKWSADTTIFIRLACDFILDLKGDAVSGAHLGGSLLPNGSGNGVPGGLFESWFFVDGATK